MKLKLTSKNIPTFILLGILIFLVFYVNDLYEKLGVHKISPVTLTTSFFNVTGNIITERRADYVFPTDSLRYQLVWTSKINDTLVITPYLEGTVGENNSFLQSKKFDSIILSKDNPLMTIHEFTLDKEGQHNLRYVIEIVNQTDGGSLEPQEIPDKIEILSRADQLQKESNQWTIIGIMISTVVASVAVFGSIYEIKRSRNEQNSTLRAWVGLESHKLDIVSYIDENNNEKNDAEIKELNKKGIEYKWTKIKRMIVLKNYGHLPAVDVKIRLKISGSEPNLKEINKISFGLGSMIFPDGTQPMIFNTTKKMEEGIADPNNDAYFLLEAQYRSTNSKTIRKMGLLLKLEASHYTIIKNWDESNTP